jgi:hypothetical protein
MTEAAFLAGRASERAELTDALKSDRPKALGISGILTEQSTCSS